MGVEDVYFVYESDYDCTDNKWAVIEFLIRQYQELDDHVLCKTFRRKSDAEKYARKLNALMRKESES